MEVEVQVHIEPNHKLECVALLNFSPIDQTGKMHPNVAGCGIVFLTTASMLTSSHERGRL